MRWEMLRARLRSATQPAHDRLDKLIESAGFFAARDCYGDYLEATLFARLPIERALSAWGAETLYPLWPQRILGSALRADVRDVRDGPNCDPESGAAVQAKPLHRAQALGVLYVLEGSALGARILIARASALGMSADFGARHLALQVSAPTAWRTLLTALEAGRLDGDEEAACIAAAIDAFTRFESAYADAHAARA